MVPSIYIEDIFVQFVNLWTGSKIPVQHQDVAAMNSFSLTIVTGKSLTQSQGNLMIKILNKYKVPSALAGLDYTDYLVEPRWKQPFRVIDFTKKVWVEVDERNVTLVCLKFPYQLKKEFDSEFGDTRDSSWDPDRKLRRLILYKFNLVQIHEFVKKHGFDIDDTFLIALGEVEEIWEKQDEIIPRSVSTDAGVTLQNSNTDALNWWNENSGKNVETDLLTAKSMGYVWAGKPHTMAEKIASVETNYFWAKDTVEFLDLCSKVDGKVCLLLDRAGKSLDWLKKFAEDLEKSNFNKEEVRICFRADKDQDPGLNEWIRNNGFGGKVEGGRLLIFNHKPAKWLFKEQENVKILASNNLYPPTNTISRDWFNSHPCVVYIGDIKPSLNKEQKIVEL